MNTPSFHSVTLKFDFEKMQSFDAPITVTKAFDDFLTRPFAIDVEDTSYFYANADERDEDFENLKSVFPQFSFVDSDDNYLAENIAEAKINHDKAVEVYSKYVGKAETDQERLRRINAFRGA
tara:strand:- start:27463 stop:27828 length:366 start_codon:yes stop_codon:yes gene_type:complete